MLIFSFGGSVGWALSRMGIQLDGNQEDMGLNPAMLGSILSLSPRFLEKASGILLSPPSIRPSVCPLCYLLPNRWTESSQIWWVACLHKWGVQSTFIFGPTPRGPGEGSKGQILTISNFKVNFKDFYAKMCTYTQ